MLVTEPPIRANSLPSAAVSVNRGVPSVCGADFDAYFEQVAPAPENYSDAGC